MEESDDGPEGGGDGPARVVIVESVRSSRLLDLIPLEIDRSLKPDPIPARPLSIPARRSHGIPTRGGTTTARPSTPSVQRTG